MTTTKKQPSSSQNITKCTNIRKNSHAERSKQAIHTRFPEASRSRTPDYSNTR